MAVVFREEHTRSTPNPRPRRVLRTGDPWDQLAVGGAALVSFHVAR